MNFEFNIPLCRDDLLTKSGLDQYVVEEVFSTRMIPSQLQEFKMGLRTKGALVVLDSFDAVFSVIKNFHQMESNVKEDAWDLIVKAMISHPNVLVGVLDGELDPTVCQVHRNTLKMNCYLLCQLMDLLEDEICRATAAAAIGAKGRKKAVRPGGDSWTMDWDQERERGVRALLQALQLNVHRLWNPPVIEEEFTSLVTNCCYKLLENPGINRKHTTRDALFQILGTMVKKHNHGLAFTLKTVQLLQHFEHLAATMALAVQVISTTFGAKTVVVEVMREIGRMDAKDLTKDTSGTRAFATFMVDLAEKIPDLMLPSISVILGLLDGESYNMRNSVLGILGEIVVRVLSKEGLDNNQKTTRDHFLDKLEDHIHDVHAFVRSKTLQIWITIVTEKALPLPRLYGLLNLTIGRLEDKSSQVRKNAIQLVSALLRSNPFAAKLPQEELRDNYEKENAKLMEMMPPEVKQEPGEVGAVSEEEENWKKIMKDVQEAISAVLGNTDQDEDNDNLILENDTVDSVTTRIVTFLNATQNKEAVQLYVMAKEAFPTEPPFSYHTQQPKEPITDGESTVESKETEEASGESCEAKLMFEGLRKLFVGEPMEVSIEEAVQDKLTHPAGQVPEGLVNEVTKQQVLVQYLKDSMEFVTLLQKAIPILCQLLESKNNSDVMEGIDFFVTSFEFGLNNAMMGIRRMLGLVWSKEANIKEAVVEAYKRLYLQAEKDNARSWAATVAKNLTALTIGASVGDLTSLEELVSQFVKTGDLTRGVIQVLWERFSLKIPQTTIPESRGALTLLGMAAVADQDIVKSNIDVLVKEGLGVRAEDDFLLARDTCGVLLKMSHINKPRENKLLEPFKFPEEHEIFQRIRHLLVTGLSKVDKNNWIPMAEEAINVIYLLGEHPDVVCRDIILELVAIINDTAGKGLGMPESDSQDEPSAECIESDRVFCDMLTRFLFMGGHVALRQLVHLDVSVFTELRRRHAIQEQKKEQVQTVPSSTVKKGKKEKNKGEAEPEELTMEEEMGLSGAIAEDAEADYIRKITEEGLVTGTANLLALLQPIIVMVCNNPSRYPDPKLQSAASLAMAKYMTVSSEFCDQHLQLLFTILEKSQNSVIRGNAIIALGNITFRFPNLIEPWTSHLYARLRDESTQVRKNTLMMLTHLILNDMVKVKGQISELATCVVDYDKCISNLAKLFFFELAKKGNAIYNIMPDIISRLSDPEVGVDEESFRIIMRYLFSFIQKDRQCENLVEKICHRFRSTRVERQWRDLAFCLSMLSYNEKSLRKLQENEACFMDKLSEEDVYNSFMTIINGARKFAKPETKTVVDEFEQRVEQSHNKGVEDDEAFAKAQAASSAARSRKPKTPGRRQGTRGHVKSRAAAKSKSKGDSDDDDDDEDFTRIKPSRKNAQRRVKPSFSSDEEDLELFEIQMQEEQGMKGKSSHLQAASNEEDGNDQENADPNVTYSSPNPVKKRHKSVCSRKPTAKTPTRSSRRARKEVV